jgi:hypothetical protein
MVFSPDEWSERPVNQMVRPLVVCVSHARVLAKPGCVIGVTPPVAPRAWSARRRDSGQIGSGGQGTRCLCSTT